MYHFPILIAFFINSNFNVNYWWKCQVAASFLPVPAEPSFDYNFTLAAIFFLSSLKLYLCAMNS